MKRLTEKEELPKVPCYVEVQEEHWKTKHRQQAIDKLGQLEDIEDELGIDLITLLKVLREGCYAIIEDKYGNLQKPQFFEKTNINKYSIGVFTYIEYLREYGYKYVLLKDYGKTWALTKEELL